MKKLVILGAGGYGQTIADVAAQSGKYDSICFLDDHSTRQDVIGRCGDYATFIAEDTVLYPAFGNNEIRLIWIEKLLAEGADVLTLVHPTAYVSPRASMGAGTIVLPKAVVMTDAKVGKGVIVNCGAIVDHGCIIEDGVHVCLSAVVKAENCIPRCMKVEAGAVIENRTYPLNGD